MEEEIETRYCFMMLLAISDSGGDVIGTDVALARTVNLPLGVFKRCVSALMEPDPDSNSQVHEGRRLMPSDSGRGYLIVNYATYRSIKTADEKKAYMREYMARYRKAKSGKDVTAVKNCKTVLGLLAHAEGEGEEELEAESTHQEDPPAPLARGLSGFPEFWKAYPKKKSKGSAEKAWLKIRDKETQAQIMDAIEKAKAGHDWTKDGGQYIPNPATWLNARGWEDEVTPPIIEGRNGNHSSQKWVLDRQPGDPDEPERQTAAWTRKYGYNAL